ncbi:Pr6Pr family membrane protein [Flavobacterium ovatum]|uniref:Pr6Pr family membrane protein n=1 Tax=Flavobacterium ovatum TaxID=1928857 RepID=UPI00344C1BCD
MKKAPILSQKNIEIAGTILGWTAVLIQLYLIINNRIASIPETLIRFFSFYTILTNILVACCFSILWLKPENGLYSFFKNYKIQTAIAVYISVVGLVYNAILRFLWNPTGLQYIVDELLHSIIPVLYLIYWFNYHQKERLNFKPVIKWLIYPLIYLLYILIRGHFSNYYPYPFIDVNILGYNKTFLNSTFLFGFFGLISILFIGISRLISKTKTP